MLKVIIIDDEVITRKGLVEFVNWEKFEMRVFGQASDGLEGLALARKVQPDLAICDIKMPRMNGIEFATQIKYVAPNCKIIFLSGYTDKEYLKSAIKLNVVDYLEKPVNMEELTKLLSSVRDLHQLEIDKYNNKNKLIAKFNSSKQHIIDSIISELSKDEYFEMSRIERLLKEIEVYFPMDAVYRMVVIRNLDLEYEVLFVNLLYDLFNEELNCPVLIGRTYDEIRVLHGHCITSDKLVYHYNEFLKEFSHRFVLETEVGIGKEVSSLRKIHDSYANALDAIEWNGFKNKNEAVTFEKSDSTIGIIRDTEKFISDNFDKNITIKDISDSVYLTPQYLCKVYKTETGITINTHITNLRMEKAKELLLNRNLKLYEVASMVGYKDSNYFSRVFKKYYGMNPSEYRDKHYV